MDSLKVVLTKVNDEYVVFIIHKNGKVEMTMQIEKYVKSNSSVTYMKYDDFKNKYMNNNIPKKESVFIPLSTCKLLKNNNYVLSSKSIKKSKISSDNVVAINHHKNKNMRLLAIADGVNTLSRPDLASSITIKTLKDWFNGLYGNCCKEKALKELLKVLKSINDIISDYSSFGMLGASLSSVVIVNDDIIYANIGSSKIYITRKKELIEVPKSDGYLGIKNIDSSIEHGFIYGCDYDGVILLTDGITNLLNDDKIEHIINVTNNKNFVLDNILHAANEFCDYNSACGAVYLK